ncbi:MAG TPA: MFS transporter [Candidatus Binataceae bacterium]
MRTREQQGWMIVVGLFLVMVIINGSGYGAQGVFFTPLLKQFGWSRAKLSLLQSAMGVTMGAAMPLAGWLLDRIETKVVMLAGALLAGAAFAAASQAHSFAPMLAAYIAFGFGMGASTTLPAAFVVSNWFEERRGVALGVAMPGASFGGTVMTLVAGLALAWGGWRVGYLAMAAPIFIVAAPLILFTVKGRPPRPMRPADTVSSDGDPKNARAAEQGQGAIAAELPGFELGEALRSRSFWLICLGFFAFAFAATGAVVHLIPFLIGQGFAPTRAALAMSVLLAVGAAGKPLFGWLADRFSIRLALFVVFAGLGAGYLLMLRAVDLRTLVIALAVLSPVWGAALALLPVLLADACGLRRYGSISGILGVFSTMGSAGGPLFAGVMFDARHSYAPVFELYAAMLLICALTPFACPPYSRIVPVAESLEVQLSLPLR